MFNKYMLRFFFVSFVVLFIFFFPDSAYSQKDIRVVVLPFEIVSEDEGLSYLQTEISKIISDHLKKDGAVVIDIAGVADLISAVEDKEVDTIRDLGLKADAAQVIWGSMSWEEQKFSIAAKMVESFGTEKPESFSVEGQGIENLLTAVQALAGKISTKLFRQEIIKSIVVEGNQRIENDAIFRIIKTKPGDIYIPKKLSEDLRAVYLMGYFDDIRVESVSETDGKKIIFTIKEKPTIRKIIVKGNRIYKEDEITESMSISSGSILNIFKVNTNIKQIKELYKEKNHHNAQVTYNVVPIGKNQADLEFVIEEGEKVRIKTITFEGNNAYKVKKLKKVMKTNEKGFWSWLTSSGEFNVEDLNQDIARMTAYYQNDGYALARVGEPDVKFEGDWIYIKIKIDEGPKFKVGKVTIDGDLIKSREELLEILKIKEETFFSRGILRNDVVALTDVYSDEGYFYVDVYPRVDEDMDTLETNITYVIEKGKPVYFDRIIISGNTSTRDKVIRRELKVYEQELYSGVKLKRGIRRLYYLDFFEDIKVDTIKGDADDKMVLKIDVKEKPTGSFSFGAGYSSVEKLFGQVSVSERNLFGRGQELKFMTEVGRKTARYRISFTEPWMFDIPLAGGLSIEKIDKDYDSYSLDTRGGSVWTSYPIYGDFTRAYLRYSYEVNNIKEVSIYASDEVKELEGENVTSRITTKLRYDSRDRPINPSSGSEHTASIEYAGGRLGGDMAFTKYTAETGWYIPLAWTTVGFLHGETGFVHANAEGTLPDYERFYLGGRRTPRGFGYHEIHVKEINEDGYETEVGGDKFLLFNVEYLIPLIKTAGLLGVLFFDAGNVWDEYHQIDPGDLRETAGYGIRWFSPIGPIRVECGYVLDRQDGERAGGKWEFDMGGVF